MITIKGQIEKAKVTLEFICEKCGTVYDADNDSFKYANQMEDRDGIEATCICPTCGTKNFRDSR